MLTLMRSYALICAQNGRYTGTYIPSYAIRQRAFDVKRLAARRRHFVFEWEVELHSRLLLIVVLVLGGKYSCRYAIAPNYVATRCVHQQLTVDLGARWGGHQSGLLL
jgi:hypothetical protein